MQVMRIKWVKNAVRHMISVVNKSKTRQSGIATIYSKLNMSSLWDLKQVFDHFTTDIICLTAFSTHYSHT